MDLIRSTVNNPSSDLGRLIKQIDISDVYLHREMEELMKRGISINQIKQLFFEPKMELSDYYEVEDIYTQPFKPYTTPTGKIIKDEVKLIGRDYELFKDNKFNLERNKYKLEDVLCQTLISSILEYDRFTKHHTKDTKVPTLDLSEYIENYEKEHGDNLTLNEQDTLELLKGMFIDSFVPAENNLPMFYQPWNREYVEGLKDLRLRGASNEQIDKYNRSYLDRILNFNAKLVKNLRIYQQLTNDFKLTKLFTNTIDFYGNNKADKWTEYLNNDLLEFLHRHSAFESHPDLKAKSGIDIDFEYLNTHLKLLETNYIARQKYKEEDKLFKEYVDFNLNRRSICKIMSPRPVPYWIWYEFWRNRDQLMYENYYKILKEIVISNPSEDLGELTKGTVQRFFSSFIPPNMRKSYISRMVNRIAERFNDAGNENIGKIIKVINKYTHSKKKNIADDYTGFINDVVKDNEIDMNVIIDKIVEMDKSNMKRGEGNQLINVLETANRENLYEERVHGPSERNLENENDLDSRNTDHERIRELIDKEGEELEIKSIGYDFRNILSFDKFEEAYKRFNLKHFGTEDYSLYKGQLVRGKVYRVSRSTVEVDIHAYALATLTLDRFYNTPSEVPLKGFLSVFKEGDELIFEVDEIWDNEIKVSLKKIRNYHKCKNILNHKKKNEIFYVKVLQRYTKGVLVQYVPGPTDDASVDGISNSDGSTTTYIKNEESIGKPDGGENNDKTEKNEGEDDSDSFDKYIRENVKKRDDLGEIGFIPIRQLSKKYKDKARISDINLVGKIIPVMYSSYEFANQIPILSTKKAVKRMQMINLKKGDIVKGYVKEYKPYYVIVKFGSLQGMLHVRDMNKENYKQHLIDYPKSILAEVKYVDPVNETILLSTKNLFEATDTRLGNANSFIRRFKGDAIPNHINRYNTFVNSRNTSDKASAQSDGVKFGAEKPVEGEAESTNDEFEYEYDPEDEKYLETVHPPEKNMVEWRLVGDKLVDEPSLMHGYNQHTWYIHLNQWTPFPSEVQDTLNYQFNNNNQVAYFNYLG
ncbi:hypothetical protein MACJ_003056 [Theileria orientalis]|uniref:S1 motif domain-containing protein n=1 Tax=Theileria orientalis TaxID=68886 RepID=A0A976M7A3_THEOR|nr:hypothetical protein MACJ_003056 [Theileria orientalis]